jgi:hypothetical protein
MSQIDQATQLPKRIRHPSNQSSSLPKVVPMIDFGGTTFFAFSNLGPFNNAMHTAPLTHNCSHYFGYSSQTSNIHFFHSVNIFNFQLQTK